MRWHMGCCDFVSELSSRRGLFHLRGVVRICNVSSGGNWGWGDSVHLGDHSWDASGDVAGCQGHGLGGHWVDRVCDWVGWCGIGGGGDWGRAVDIDRVGGLCKRAGVGLARAVGHLSTAGGDGINNGGALRRVNMDSSSTSG